MQTSVPIGTFEGKARDLLDIGEFDGLLELLARRPKAGRIVQSTRELRKLRIARKVVAKAAAPE